MPCGQGVGAIDELVPAGDLVARMVAEAERTLSSGIGAATMTDLAEHASTPAWADDILPALHDYIAHPQRVAGLRRRLGGNGHMDARRRPDPRLVRGAARSPA